LEHSYIREIALKFAQMDISLKMELVSLAYHLALNVSTEKLAPNASPTSLLLMETVPINAKINMLIEMVYVNHVLINTAQNVAQEILLLVLSAIPDILDIKENA
jgi:hypothetical protein